MAKYGSPDIKIEVDNAGGTLQNMTAYIDEVNEVNVEALLQESHTFGDSWVENLYTGVKRGNAITFSGFYDDTATTGPDAIFNDLGDTREVKITYDGSTGAKYTLFEAIITNYVRSPSRGENTRYSVTFTPTGEIAEDAALGA